MKQRMIIGLLVLLTCPYYLGSVSLLGKNWKS